MKTLARKLQQTLIAGLPLALPLAAALALAWPAEGKAPADGDNVHCAAPGGPDAGGPAHGGMPPMGPPPPWAMGGPGMMPPEHMFPGEEPAPPFLRGLTLTEAQQDKIFAIVHAAAPLLREQAKLVRKNADRLRELTVSNDYDEAKLKALAEAGARASAEITLLHARSTHQILALLTPEQRAEADAMKAKFQAHQGIRAQIEDMKPKFEHSATPESR